MQNQIWRMRGKTLSPRLIAFANLVHLTRDMFLCVRRQFLSRSVEENLVLQESVWEVCKKWGGSDCEWNSEEVEECCVFEMERAWVRNYLNLSPEQSFRRESFICEVKFALWWAKLEWQDILIVGGIFLWWERHLWASEGIFWRRLQSKFCTFRWL